MGFSNGFDWIQEQATYILYSAVIILGLILAFKRQWIAMVGTFAGLAIIGLFITKPDIIKSVGTTVGGWIGIS